MSRPEFVARLTLCKCGHRAIAHYDSHLFCIECDECEQFEAAEPEVIVHLNQLPQAAESDHPTSA
jgi:threonine aldolase